MRLIMCRMLRVIGALDNGFLQTSVRKMTIERGLALIDCKVWLDLWSWLDQKSRRSLWRQNGRRHWTDMDVNSGIVAWLTATVASEYVRNIRHRSL